MDPFSNRQAGWAWSLIRNEKPIGLFEKTGMRLRRQRPLLVQGDASHPG
jgi:hypothetical protein